MKATLKEQLEAFDHGRFIDSSGAESECFNFYDWFCRDSSLQNKAKSLFTKVKRFLKANPDIDPNITYVFFKNNCPVSGPLYDDFRIVDIATGNVVFTVTPKCGHSGLAEIWGRSNDFNGPIKTADTFSKLFLEKG